MLFFISGYCVTPLSPVVLCTVRLSLRVFLFLGYWLPLISRGTMYLESVSQNVIVLGYW